MNIKQSRVSVLRWSYPDIKIFLCLLTIPYKLSFFTWQGSTAVDPICALTVVAFLLIKTQCWSASLIPESALF